MITHSKVKVMMIVITILFKSENAFLKDSNRFWLLNKTIDLNGRSSEEYSFFQVESCFEYNH